MEEEKGKKDKKQKEPTAKPPAVERYGEVHELPSGIEPGTVTIMEMTTREESLMTKQKGLRDGSAIETVLNNCVKEDVDLERLLLGDRYFLMVRIRAITYGPDYVFSARCPQCGKTFSYGVNLDKLPVRKLKKAADHVYELTLPRSGHVVRWRHITGKDETVLLEARRGTDDDALIPVSLRLHTVALDDGKVPPGFFETLGGMDSRAYRDDILVNGSGVDTLIDVTCSGCEADFTVDMPIGENFFWPSAARKG